MKSIVDDLKWILEFGIKQNNMCKMIQIIKTKFLTNKNKKKKNKHRNSNLRFPILFLFVINDTL